MRGEKMRKKFTTVLSRKTILALELIAANEEMSSKNDVIEYLVREYIRNNNRAFGCCFKQSDFYTFVPSIIP